MRRSTVLNVTLQLVFPWLRWCDMIINKGLTGVLNQHEINAKNVSVRHFNATSCLF
jgi:hypothetical protein